MDNDSNQVAPSQAVQEENKQGQVVADPSDKLTEDHPRFKDVVRQREELKTTIAELKDELKEIKENVKERRAEDPSSEMTLEERESMEKIARELNKRGYATKEDVERNLRSERRAAQYERLSSKYDGHNGYPTFSPIDVEEHAKRKGFADPEEAYLSLNREAIIQIEAKKYSHSSSTVNSEKPSGGQRPSPDTEVTPEEIKNMSDEEYEKNRGKLLTSLKANLK